MSKTALSIFEPLIEHIAGRIDEMSLAVKAVRPPDTAKKEAFQRALKEIAVFRGRPLFYPYLSAGMGRGPLVQLQDGSVKLDFICGIGPHILGHSHPEIIKACLRAALEDGVMQGHLQMSAVYHRLLRRLVEIAGKNSRLKQAWICPSGTMANENALKAIRQKQGGARKILAFERAFAGRSAIMCEITDNPAVKEGLPPYHEVLRVPFCPKDPDKALKALKAHWKSEGPNIACFIMELMQGDGGCFRAGREFFVPLLDFCQSKNIAIWFDEVQTFGRSGAFFAFESLQLGEYVDVCTVGKALQLSVSFWTEDYNPRPGLVSGTFSASTSSFHSALAILDQLEPLMGPRGEIQKIHDGWRERLKSLEDESLLSRIEGWGLMMGATALDGRPEQTSRLLQILFQKGLMCFSCGSQKEKRLRFLLPAITRDIHLDQAFGILREALRELKQTS